MAHHTYSGGGATGNGRGSHECRSRDIRRRLEVIQKKMTDLQELGIPCAFCYVSVRNTGSLFTMGDSTITQVIEGCSDTILQQVSETQTHHHKHQHMLQHPAGVQRSAEVRMVLPPLPTPLEQLGAHELRTLVVGIIKDLQLKWTDPKPPFWPSDIPFQNPRSVPEGFQGYWTMALRRVVHSIYSFFNPGGGANTERIQPSPPCLSPDDVPLKADGHPRLLMGSPIDSMRAPLSSEESSSPGVAESPCGVGHISRNTQSAQPSTVMVTSENEEDKTSNTENEEDLDSDMDTISVCSVGEDERENEPSDNGAVSYFGYEIAPSDPSSSPHPPSNQSSDHEEGEERAQDSAGVTAVPPLLQPLFCYDPRLYGHLCSSSLQLPFLVPPNLLMKQAYPLSTTTIKTVPRSTKASVIAGNQSGKDVGGRSQEVPAPKMPLTFSFKLPKTSFSVIQNSPSDRSEISSMAKHHPLPEDLAKVRRSKTEEHKGRRTRNGIFVYTTPTTPPKFVSLNSKKDDASRKLVAGEPIRSSSKGESVVVKDSRLRLHVVAPPERVNKEETAPAGGTNHVSASGGGGGGVGKRLPLKRKKELVFHWYQTPQAQNQAKRTKSVNATN